MARNNRSARKAGASFERLIADYLNDEYQPGIDRMIKKGINDEGDISGVTVKNGEHRVAIECKSPGGNRPYSWPQYVREAEQEAENLGAVVGVVAAKRHGTTVPGDQWIMMTVDSFITLMKLTNGVSSAGEGDLASITLSRAELEDDLRRYGPEWVCDRYGLTYREGTAVHQLYTELTAGDSDRVEEV